MSHFKERKEKNCLNCNAEVAGKYCQVCGQENIEPKESFWSLATHFVYDVLHFDGKFFSTMKYLLLKPGFLSHEFLRGRRASYLHPIKMYVFTSAIFFIIFLSFIVHADELGETVGRGQQSTAKKINIFRDSLQKAISKEKDTAQQRQLNTILAALDNYDRHTADAAIPGQDSLEKDTVAKGNIGHVNPEFTDADDLPETEAAYDSAQHLLPEDQRDGWFKSWTQRKMIGVKHRYEEDPHRFWESFVEKFLHSLPQIMFITLPLVALLLQLLYIRRRKEIFYVNHVIFITHVYIALFIAFMLHFGISALYSLTGFVLFSWINYLVDIYIFIYCIWAMRNFYGQGIAKSTLKYFILLFLAFILFSMVFTVYVIKSFM